MCGDYILYHTYIWQLVSSSVIIIFHAKVVSSLNLGLRAICEWQKTSFRLLTNAGYNPQALHVDLILSVSAACIMATPINRV